MPNVPVVVRGKIRRWKILSFGQKDWCDAFGGQSLRFRKGNKLYREEPYWEHACDEEIISLDEFFERSTAETENDHWLYFDYKYVKDVFTEGHRLFQGINWEDVGLSKYSGKDSTIWIGNKGAHTPCHMDTYGCNVVAQIYGRKLWILIPPEETDVLEPTRVPYEESSIYSSHNFYTPNFNILRIRKAFKVILNPGEVLYVPERWWHYVENLEPSVSVNVWIPLESDRERRLEEALVRHYVSVVCQDLTEDEAKTLVNPNEREILSSPFDIESLRVHVANYKTMRSRERPSDDRGDDDLDAIKKIFGERDSVPVNEFDESDAREYVERKCLAHNYSLPPAKASPGNPASLAKILIDSYCHPSVVASVREKIARYHPQ